jgi:thiamine-phosphate pyrophosphorylase
MPGPPSGIWAVGSGLAGADAAEAWAAGLAGAAAWTFRRPACEEGETVRALKRLAADAPFLAVHGRGDWAAVSGARAVVAGRGSLGVAALRTLFPALLVGASVHDEDETAAAVGAGADFLVYGPVWDTPAKAGVLAPRGLGALARAAEQGLPVVAIGGITEPGQARACREHGAHGAAVLRAAADPARFAELVAAWREA